MTYDWAECYHHHPKNKTKEMECLPDEVYSSVEYQSAVKEVVEHHVEVYFAKKNDVDNHCLSLSVIYRSLYGTHLLDYLRWQEDYLCDLLKQFEKSTDCKK